MDKNRKARKLTEKEVEYILSIKNEDINKKLLEDLFAFTLKSEAKFNTNDFFQLPKNTMKNSTSFQTTVGRYIFNRLILYPDLIKYISYINEPMDGDKIEELDNLLAKYLIEDKITRDQFGDYIDKMQWLGFTCAKFLNSSLTYNLLIPPKETMELKNELLNKYKKEIDNGDIVTVNKIENELLDDAKKRIKDIPDMEIYNSKSRGSFSNNYKNTSLMRGVIKNLGDPNSIHVSTASLMEGIPPKDMPYYADIITQASYSRAVGTREGGLIYSSL